MYNLAVVTIWYNDPSIKRMIESLPSWLPIFVIDGKFGGGLSDEKLRDEIRKYDNVILIDSPNLTEIEKRNVSLFLTRDFKYCLVMDSDEYVIESDWKRFFEEINKKDEGVYCIILENTTYGKDVEKTSGYGKLIINPPIWEYVDCHNMLKNKKTGVTKSIHKMVSDFFENLVLRQDDKLRSEEYLKEHDEYIAELIKRESAIRGER